MYREPRLNLYDIMIIDDPTEEALDVLPIQCDVLQGSQDQMYLTEEGSRMKLYSEWVQKNFLKVSKMFGVSFLGLDDRILNLIEEIEMRYIEEEKGKKYMKKKLKRSRGRGNAEVKKASVASQL